MKQSRKSGKVVKKTKPKIEGKLNAIPVKQVIKRGKSSVVDQGNLVKDKTSTKKGKRNIKKTEKKEVNNETHIAGANEEIYDTFEQKVNENSPKDGKKNSSRKRNPYTLFVGNLPFTATPEEVRIHFEKVGRVKEVRLPLSKKTNKRQGFGYVQLRDRTSYEKALTLHNSHILGRKINVEYTTQGKKGGPKEEKIKKKTLKLRALTRNLKEEIKSSAKGAKGKGIKRTAESSLKKSAK